MWWLWVLLGLLALLALALLVDLLFNGVTLLGAYIQGRQRFVEKSYADLGYESYPAGVFRAYLRELYASYLLAKGSLLAPFLKTPNYTKHADNSRLPVLFLHGYTENHLTWSPLLRALAKEEKRRRYYTLWMRPANASILRFREQANKKIDAILKETGHSQVILIGHSMGGIVARAVMVEYGQSRIARVITIATPHLGTSWSFIFPATPALQMQSRGPFLAALKDEGRQGSVPFLCIATVHDNIVAPFDQAWLAGAELMLISGVAHVGLLHDKRVIERLALELAKPDAVAAHPLQTP